MSPKKEYEDFDAFMEKVLNLVKKEKESKLDYWLGASSSVLGASVLMRLLPRIGMGFGAAGAAGLLAGTLFPIIGVASIAGAGLLAAKYISKANTEEGVKISDNLRSAKYLFEEYVSSNLSEKIKKKLIDDLLERLVSGKTITH